MHVYNAIVVMKEILGVFPLSTTSEAAGVFIDQAIDKFLEDETRGDLKILAKSYVAILLYCFSLNLAQVFC